MANEIKHQAKDMPLPKSREKTFMVTMGKVGGAEEESRDEILKNELKGEGPKEGPDVVSGSPELQT
jgi:predicted lipoprotein